MKKYLFILILLLALPAMGFAQEEDSPYFQTKNEIGVSYGFLPSGFFDAQRKGLSQNITSFWRKTDELSFFGPFSLDYAHFVNNKIAIGVNIGYYKYSHKMHPGIFFQSLGDAIADGLQIPKTEWINNDDRTYFYAIPSVKYYWERHERWSWYCMLGAGVHYLHEKEFESKYGEITQNYDRSRLYFGFQATPLGVEYTPNPHLVFCLQCGYGDMGLLNFGIKTRW